MIPAACEGSAEPLVDTRISGRANERGHLQLERGPAEAGEPTPVPQWERARRARYLHRLEESAREAERAREYPAYIQACASNPDRPRTYWVYTWEPGDPTTKKRIPYLCGSWKCPHCREHAGHVLWSRLQEAFGELDSRSVVFCVLTLDPAEHLRGHQDLAGVYRDFAGRQNRFMKRLRRWLIERYGQDMGNAWASVTECHASGIPHVNIAVYHPQWSAGARARRSALEVSGITGFQLDQMEPELLTHAQECGFGWRCSAEANRDDSTEAISGYLVKGVKSADAMHGEMAKRSQLPVMAPKNFRRLRCGKGFLPPRRRGTCTGAVLRRYRTPEGDEHVEPLSKPAIRDLREWEPVVSWLADHPEATDDQLPDDLLDAWEVYRDGRLAYMAEVEHACRIEQVCAWKDEGVTSHRRRQEQIQTYQRAPDGRTLDPLGTVVLQAPSRHTAEHGTQIQPNFDGSRERYRRSESTTVAGEATQRRPAPQQPAPTQQQTEFWAVVQEPSHGHGDRRAGVRLR